MTLDDYIRRSGMTDSAFAEKAGLSQPFVGRLRRLETTPSFSTVRSIERATNGRVKLKDWQPALDATE